MRANYLHKRLTKYGAIGIATNLKCFLMLSLRNYAPVSCVGLTFNLGTDEKVIITVIV